jgi:hypothetical protein
MDVRRPPQQPDIIFGAVEGVYGPQTTPMLWQCIIAGTKILVDCCLCVTTFVFFATAAAAAAPAAAVIVATVTVTIATFVICLRPQRHPHARTIVNLVASFLLCRPPLHPPSC